MNLRTFFLTSLIALSMSSCLVVSLHPLGTADQQIFDSKLLGEWNTPDMGSRYVFEPLGDETFYLLKIHQLASTDTNQMASPIFTGNQSVNMTVYDGNDTIQKTLTNRSHQVDTTLLFEARLFQLGKHYFLDLYPGGKDRRERLMLEGNYLAVHTFVKIIFEEDKLQLQSFDNEMMRDLFKQNRIRLANEEVDKATVITAPTEDIQRFIEKYADEHDVFEEPTILTKNLE